MINAFKDYFLFLIKNDRWINPTSNYGYTRFSNHWKPRNYFF